MSRASAELGQRLSGWLEGLTRFLLVVLVGVGVAGVPLAIVGRFEPPWLIVLAGLVAVGLWLAIGGRSNARRPSKTRRLTNVPLVGILIVVTALSAWNVTRSSSYLMTFRDPAVYTTTARWLADHGDLLPRAHQGPFRDHPGLHEQAAGYEDRRADGRLTPQFVHLLPVYLAVGAWIGGSRGLLATNAVLGGIALLLVFSLATRFLRGWWALAGVAALGISLPQLYFARNTFSEVPAQALVAGGVWALWEGRQGLSEGRPFVGWSLTGGLAVGAVSMARIDGFLLLIPLALYLGVESLRARRHRTAEQRQPLHFAATAALGAGTTAGIALADGLLRSPGYFHDQRHDLRLIVLGLTLVAACVLISHLLMSSRWAIRPVRRIAASRRAVGVAMAVGVVAIAIFLGIVRPAVEQARQASANSLVGRIGGRQGTIVDARRTFAEDSVLWQAWYLGPVTIAAGFAGLALATARWGRDRLRDVAILPIATFAIVAGLYLWAPHITADHIWAMRRYLPVVLPGLVLLAMLFAQSVWSWSGGRRQAFAGRTLATGVALAAIAFPAAATWPVRDVRVERPRLATMQTLCDRIGPDGAVVVLRGEHLHEVLPPAIRSFCNVPVAATEEAQPLAFFQELDTEWHRDGRTLVLVGSTRDQFSVLGADVTVDPPIVSDVVTLEATLRHRPRHVVEDRLELWTATL